MKIAKVDELCAGVGRAGRGVRGDGRCSIVLVVLLVGPGNVGVGVRIYVGGSGKCVSEALVDGVY